jgi:RNA polymerase sigma-70 factor (ECF subfamily)
LIVTMTMSPTVSRRGFHPWYPEQQLFLAWRSGEAFAGHALVGRIRVHLQRFFRARTRCDELAEDLVQETLLVCVKAKQVLVDATALKAYVYTAARRILARELERRDRAAAAFDESVLIDDADLHAEHERRAAIARLRYCLGASSTQCTRAAALHFLEGHRGREIAALLEVSEGTVRSRIRHGLGQLRRALEEPPALGS